MRTEQTSGAAENLRLFTFWVEEYLYGVDISLVLSVSQEIDNIRPIAGELGGAGLLGMIEFQKQVVPVVDFADAMGLQSGIKQAQTVVDQLVGYEAAHVDWLNALETSLDDKTPFQGCYDPEECDFGRWYQNFSTADETLSEILRSLDQPHRRIHSLAHHFSGLVECGKLDEAARILSYEREVTMARLNNRFELARTHVAESVRAVLLYITQDGQTPSMALKIDRIHDVVEYHRSGTISMDRLEKCISARTKAIVKFYLYQKDRSDCLMIDPMRIVDLPGFAN